MKIDKRMENSFFLTLKKLEKAAIFSPQPTEPAWIMRIWQAIVYFFGVYLWMKFFDVKDVASLNFHDWHQITIPRVDFIRQAIQSGILPLHASNTYMLHDITDRFLALADVITTPQMVLLGFVDIPTYILLEILIHYTIAFVSLNLVRKKFNLSLLVLTTLVFLFNFNGYILSHYSVGHFSWSGYFLFPAFFLLVFEFMDSKVGWAWIAKMSLLLFYMVLAGSLHHYIWLLIFLGVLVIAQWRKSIPVIAAAFFSGMLASIRLLPPALELANLGKRGMFDYVLGYPSIMELLFSMAISRRPRVAFDEILFFQTDTIIEYYWEFNYFIGTIGLLFLLFGLFLWLRDKQPIYWQLIIPALVVFILALGSTYRLLKMTDLPLLQGERVTTRMVSVPITFFILIASVYIQKWLDQREFSTFHKLLLFAVPLLVGLELYTNLILWKISASEAYFGAQPATKALSAIANRPDPPYEGVLLVGSVLFTATILLLTRQVIKERRI